MADEPSTTDPKDTDPSTTPPAADPTQAPTDGVKPEKPDVTFTPEQQAALEKILSEKLGKVKERTSAEIQAAQKLVEERDALLKTYRDKEDAATKEQEEKERKRLEEKGEFEKIIALDRERAEADRKKFEEAKAAAEQERDSWRKQLELTKIDNALLALFAADAVDPEAAVQLFKNAHKVTLDPTTMNVVIDGDTDTPLQSKAQEFLSTRDYLSKSKYAGKSGAGSSGSPGTGTSGQTFTAEQIADYAFYKKHKEAIDRQVSGG